MVRRTSTSGPLAAVRSLTDAWMRKEAEEMARWLSDDIVEIGPAFRNPLIGKHNFFLKYRSYIDGPTHILSYRILRPRTLRLSPSLVLVHFQYRMRTLTRGVTETFRGKESMLIVKKRKRWIVRFIHWHRDPGK